MMPDENRVFDVAKPGRLGPPPTSRPVIVGHHPIMNDPMVKEGSDPTHIQILDNSSKTIEPPTGQPPETTPPPAAEQPPEPTQPNFSNYEPTGDHFQPLPVTETAPAATPAPAFESPTPNPESSWPGSTTLPPVPPAEPAITPPAPTEPNPSQSHIEGLHFAPPKRRGRGLRIIALILVILIGLYLAIDAGVIKTSLNLPFHVFKQKNNTSASTGSQPQTQPAASTGPVVPAGFKEYKLADTSITFAAPTSWGDPASVTQAGYTTRGGSAQPTGTYAYLVTFATNKDIEIAVTSNKYLPPARATTYYDYLQWCTGTNDGKIYESILKFSTANKVDTPTTITCDQGPVPSVVKIDDNTIVQAKAQDTANKVIGDIYTKNLKDPSLVVFRVKDAAMTNGDDIKSLLDTVQVGS